MALLIDEFDSTKTRPQVGRPDGAARVSPKNVLTPFRDAFEVLSTDRWSIQTASGDIIAVDGNALGASYLVISKNPLVSDGSASTVTSIPTFSFPSELSLGVHMSQRTLGQEFAIDVVSTEGTLAVPADLAISAIQQATTTLTVTTTLPHGLKPGSRISIFGVTQDSRLNYPALVVASITSATQFTATAGPAGNIPSLTLGPFASGTVSLRSTTGFAKNAVCQLFENATATNASLYIKSESGDVHVAGGTVLGNHSVGISSTASVQAAGNIPLTYSFQPTAEQRILVGADRIQFMDATIDSSSAPTVRALRTQVVPDPTKQYVLRFRATNNKGLTVPVAEIVSMAKTGTTTATVTTDVAHGLTTGDQVCIYGGRDQTNFANLTVATAVASVVNATQFTVVIGTAVTATTYGGTVYRVNGGNLPSALGAIAQVASSVSVAAGILTLIGNTNWSGLSIGDYVNLQGMRADLTGADLVLDGAYRVRNTSTTTLELEPIGATPVPGNLASTNCGGAVIKRTDMRVSFVRVFDFERQRVEVTPGAVAASSVPVAVVGMPTTNVNNTEVAKLAPSTTFLTAAATVNATNVKTTAGTVYGVHAFNYSAADKFIKLYNKASAPTVGTDIPVHVVKVPAGGSVDLMMGGEAGIRFGAGVSFAITGLLADADTTALAAGDVKMTLVWV